LTLKVLKDGAAIRSGLSFTSPRTIWRPIWDELIAKAAWIAGCAFIWHRKFS
jgi:hypothetical protein